MKKIFVILLIFSLSTFIFCEDDNFDFKDLSPEDIKILKNRVSEVLPILKELVNDLKNTDSEVGNLLYNIFDKIYSLLNLFSPILNEDPKSFIAAIIEIKKKVNNLNDYFNFNELIKDIPYDLLLDAEYILFSDPNFNELLDIIFEGYYDIIKIFNIFSRNRMINDMNFYTLEI